MLEQAKALQELAEAFDKICKATGLTCRGKCKRCGFEGLQDENGYCLECIAAFEEPDMSQD